MCGGCQPPIPFMTYGRDVTGKRTRLLAVVAAAVAGAAVAIVASIVTSSSTDKSGELRGASEVRSLMRGIPQRGYTLGRSDAPATLIEFVDLQCPYCAQLARDGLPAIIANEVRSGRLRLELRILSFLGPDSQTAARFAAGAARQNRVWQFTELFFRNQGRENSGYVTEDFLRKVAGAIDGLDVDRALAFSRTPESEDDLERANSEARKLGVTATPTLFLVQGGGRPRQLALSDLTADAVRSAISAARQP